MLQEFQKSSFSDRGTFMGIYLRPIIMTYVLQSHPMWGRLDSFTWWFLAPNVIIALIQEPGIIIIDQSTWKSTNVTGTTLGISARRRSSSRWCNLGRLLTHVERSENHVLDWVNRSTDMNEVQEMIKQFFKLRPLFMNGRREEGVTTTNHYKSSFLPESCRKRGREWLTLTGRTRHSAAAGWSGWLLFLTWERERGMAWRRLRAESILFQGRVESWKSTWS